MQFKLIKPGNKALNSHRQGNSLEKEVRWYDLLWGIAPRRIKSFRRAKWDHSRPDQFSSKSSPRLIYIVILNWSQQVFLTSKVLKFLQQGVLFIVKMACYRGNLRSWNIQATSVHCHLRRWVYIPSGTSHQKSPNVDFPSKPPNKRYRAPIQVMEWYARGGGGPLLVGKCFHWTETKDTKLVI